MTIGVRLIDPLRRTACYVLAASLLALGMAAAPAPAAESVTVEVWAIRATTRNTEVSPELRNLARQLRRQFKFTGLKLEGRKTDRAELNKTVSSRMPGNYEVVVTPLRKEGERVTLRVEAYERRPDGRKKRADYKITINAGCFQFWGGLALDHGDELIFGVSAK